MNRLSLNDLYRQYNDKIISRNNFESRVYNYFANNQGKTILSFWKSDEYEDFVSWFYPRLSKAIDKYNHNGPGFESFINKYFAICSREYKTRSVTGNITEYSAWSAKIPDLYVHEEPPEYGFGKNEKLISEIIKNKNGRKNARRLLALIIKCYNYVSDDFIEKVAPIIDIEKEALKEMLDKIRRLRQKRDDEIYLLKEKLYSQFYRCIILEKRLLTVRENTSAFTKLNKQLKNARIKLDKLRIKLTVIRKEATNSQVAEVIGVCKGSVDSGLFKLKEKYSRHIN